MGAATQKQNVKTAAVHRTGRGTLMLRVVAAIGGGYACTAALASAGAQLLVLAGGMARSEAVFLVAMLGFVLYLALLLWSFTEASVWRVWAWLSVGIVIGVGLSYGLAPPLVEY